MRNGTKDTQRPSIPSSRGIAANPSAGSLIEKETFEPQQVDGMNAYRRERFRRRAEAQHREIKAARAEAGLDPNGNDGFVKLSARFWCGTPRRFGGGAVGINVKDTDHGKRAHYSHVQHCGSVWACPVCSPYIRRERGGEVAEGARIHLERGGGLLMATYTLRHAWGDSLADLLKLKSEAWAFMNRSRAFRQLKEDYGLSGYISATEMTLGQHGWHPHAHVLWFTEQPIDAHTADMLRHEMFEAWCHAVERVGARTIDEQAFDLRAVESGEEAVASYITKTADGIAKEVTLADVKAGRAGSINPFQLLDLNTDYARELWAEYVNATKGKSAIRWSRGLRQRLGMEAARTDEEIANDLERVGETVVFIAPSVYNNSIGRDHSKACDLLEAVERGDYDRAAGLIGGHARPIPLDGRTVPIFE